MSKKNIPLPALHPNSSLMDSHCHLDMSGYQADLDQVVQRAYSLGIKHIITIGIDFDSSQSAIHLASKYSHVHATAGIHPHDVDNITLDDLEAISSLIEKHRDKVVGYGEIGLDYVKRYSSEDTQKKLLTYQLAIAKEHKLPIIIHDREAHDDIFRILKENAPFDQGGVMHCFSGDVDFAKTLIDLGLHISIPGVVTFNKAFEMQMVAAEIPLDKLLVETDGPFLAPVPFRGKRNEPMYLLYTAAKIAELRNISLEEVAAATTENGLKLFNITAP